MAATEDLVSYLKSVKSSSDESLHDHIHKIFRSVVYDKPSNPVDSFEDYSYSVKKAEQKAAQTKLRYNANKFEGWIWSTRELLARKTEENEEGDVIESVPDALPMMPNFQVHSEMLKWAGVYFGEEDSYVIQLSLKKLANASGATGIRFWGKIYGVKADYYIAEGSGGNAAEEGEEEPPEDMERKGVGINTLTYWATTDLRQQEWTELPDLMPNQLGISRNIRMLFTGDLEAKMYTNPHFIGREKHYLRAQIGRISHATTIVPSGMYEVNEEEQAEIGPTEEYVIPDTPDLASLDAWSHYTPNILKNCRISHPAPIPPEDTEITEEEMMEAILAQDPVIERIRTIDQDEPLSGYNTAWIHKKAGDQTIYLNPQGEEVCNGLNIFKSLRWPGALTVQQNGKWVQIYLGNGLKGGTETYYPISPPVILEEPEDIEEQYEPNPEFPPSSDVDEDEEEGSAQESES